MIGAIIGDIVGSRFEFHNHLSKEFDFFHPSCEFTDDTVMTCAVAQALMDSKPDYSDLSEKTVEAMQRIGQQFPGCGYEKVDSQFMLGPKYLVAPVVREDDSVTVYLPAGRWKDDQGKKWRGPKVLKLTDVPVERLPYFEKVK